jgi:hypothetical protein
MVAESTPDGMPMLMKPVAGLVAGASLLSQPPEVSMFLAAPPASTGGATHGVAAEPRTEDVNAKSARQAPTNVAMATPARSWRMA